MFEDALPIIGDYVNSGQGRSRAGQATSLPRIRVNLSFIIRYYKTAGKCFRRILPGHIDKIRLWRANPSRALTIDQNVRCQRITPVEGSAKTITELHTVGFTLTKDQAIHLARVLLAATQDWDIIDVTAFRLQQRSDGTFPVTITSVQKTK